MSIPDELVEKAAAVLSRCCCPFGETSRDCPRHSLELNKARARAVLAAVWGDLPAAQPTPCPRGACRGHVRHSWLRHWLGWLLP